MIVFFIIIALLILTYIVSEIDHCRRGNDVYNWTKQLVKWLDRK